MADETKLAEVVAEGDTLFGKAFIFLKEVGEDILVEIETEAGKIERFFHKNAVKVISGSVPNVVTASQVSASGVASTATPVNPPNTPPIPEQPAP